MALVRDENKPQYRIEASGSLCQSRSHILKHDITFAVLNDFGDMVGVHGNPEGLYHRDTRFLSQLDVRLNDGRPLLLSSTPADNSSLLSVDLANTDVIGADAKPLH